MGHTSRASEKFTKKHFYDSRMSNETRNQLLTEKHFSDCLLVALRLDLNHLLVRLHLIFPSTSRPSPWCLHLCNAAGRCFWGYGSQHHYPEERTEVWWKEEGIPCPLVSPCSWTSVQIGCWLGPVAVSCGGCVPHLSASSTLFWPSCCHCKYIHNV